ncbi:MAG TPA: type II toxin-antitoxin system HigB family toxin [Tepidisphaeraceae bacterium]|nr:type II toxin-antitoxin system HigB family toxin [Tepidisphaeraceae bacterium]
MISKRRLREFWEKHHDAELALKAWFKIAERSDWANFADVRATIATASGVPLECGITAIVFNIGGNKYRLVTRIEYVFHTVYVKMVLTHPQYDTDRWKDELCRR